jgi:pimeloyl-ACP methyl ester carboxylesterase
VHNQLGYGSFLTVVGTSFGGPQAIAYASQFPHRARSLILHSAAPSTRAYPDAAMLHGQTTWWPCRWAVRTVIATLTLGWSW